MPADLCPLCTQAGGDLIWRGRGLRVIAVDDPDYTGFTRVVWDAHVAEMTDLAPGDRETLMQAVYTVERVMRDMLAPDKVNLAAFGNMVPHLHWHIIPRWQGDRHFPDPYWAAPRVLPDQEPADWPMQRQARLNRLLPFHEALPTALDGMTQALDRA